MQWAAPPTRREVTLLLFAFTVYLLFYNIESSLHALGVNTTDSQSRLLKSLGLKSSPGSSAIEKDGRKPEKWRDTLELDIFGDWAWENGHVAGDENERSQGKGVGMYGAVWQSPFQVGYTSMTAEKTTFHDMMEAWDDVPLAEIWMHVPGYTVVKNAIMFNRSVYLVSDDESSIPSVELISSSMKSSDEREWRVITTAQARDIIPNIGGRMTETTWISTDSQPDVTTLFALWRAQSSLDKNIDSSGHTKLSPPRRLFFSGMVAYSDPSPADLLDLRPRIRSDVGFPPLLAKFAFPNLGPLFRDDWNDYQLMQSPFIIETAIIADRAASGRNSGGHPSMYELLGQNSSAYWWEPVRQSLAASLETLGDQGKSQRTVVTYVHKQTNPAGLRLENEDHLKLIEALKGLGRSYEVHVVSDTDDWVTKLTAITKSTVVIGVHGDHLFDSVFMKSSPQPLLMELFPENTISLKNELAIKATGGRYIAWWNQIKFDDKLPEAAEPTNERVQLDSQAVVRAIQQAAK